MVRKKKVPTLATRMARAFEEVAERRMADPTAKRFFIALMLALPTIEGHELNTMVSTLERHLGYRKVEDTFETLL